MPTASTSLFMSIGSSESITAAPKSLGANEEGLRSGCFTDDSPVNLLILDLECTCEKHSNLTPTEIIEIGAVVGILSSRAFTVTDELQIYVRPVINPMLTPFCTQLTGITQSTVDAAVVLSECLPVLQAWLQKGRVQAWTSWGKFDFNQFLMECELKGLINPLKGAQHLNLKQLFARKFGHRVGLQRALDLRGIEFEGRLHSGIADAQNIASLIGKESLLRAALLKRILRM